jgi:PAS domain S-box-containing protein
MEISEREQMNRELRQMAAIVESSEDAIVGQSLDGTITSWNKGAERLFGYSRQSIVGQPQSVLVPPDHENELPAIRARIQRGEHVNRFETVRKTRDGRRIFVSLTVSPVHDDTGTLIGVASIARDVTGRKQAQEALRNSEENLKRAQSVAHIGSWYLNIARNELRWSDETYQIFGVPLGTPMTYEKFLAVVQPVDRERVEQAWTAAMRGDPYDLEHRILVGGKSRWIHEKAELEFDADGHVVSASAPRMTSPSANRRRKASAASLNCNLPSPNWGSGHCGPNRPSACWMKPLALSPGILTSTSATCSSCSRAAKSCCFARVSAGRKVWWAVRQSRQPARSRGS